MFILTLRFYLLKGFKLILLYILASLNECNGSVDRIYTYFSGRTTSLLSFDNMNSHRVVKIRQETPGPEIVGVALPFSSEISQVHIT